MLCLYCNVTRDSIESARTVHSGHFPNSSPFIFINIYKIAFSSILYQEGIDGWTRTMVGFDASRYLLLLILLMLGPSLSLWTSTSTVARTFVTRKHRTLLFANAFSSSKVIQNCGRGKRKRVLYPAAQLFEISSSSSDVVDNNNDNNVGVISKGERDYVAYNNVDDDNEKSYRSPWNTPDLAEKSKNRKNYRSRQHVNPLARRFQEPTVLSGNWPNDVYDNLSSTKPFFLDIGCARGGFLINMASQFPKDYNYLGLEIRPSTAYYAKQRVAKHNLFGHLDFVGCNANVDLERLLSLITAAQRSNDNNKENETDDDNSSSSSIGSNSNNKNNHCNLQMVTIQFPDPHFKARHSKRRVVTPLLVTTLGECMPTGKY